MYWKATNYQMTAVMDGLVASLYLPIFGIEGEFYPNPCSASKNAPKGMKEFYPRPPIETKSWPSEPQDSGHLGPQNDPDCIKMLA